MAKWSLAGINGQEEQRRVETFIDQHGREYVTNVEISTGDPCSALQPIDWTAPQGPDWFRGLLMPPEHLRQMVHRMERARKRYQIEINYVQWLSEIDERDDAWDSRLANLAQSSTKGLGFADVIANPPAALLDYLGPKAFPPRVFVEAMAAGDPWALGFSDRVPKKAVLLLEQMKPFITKRPKLRAGDVLVNPFAENDEESNDAAMDSAVDELGEALTSDLRNIRAESERQESNPFSDNDALDDLDEMFDPQASGGKTEKKGRRPRVER